MLRKNKISMLLGILLVLVLPLSSGVSSDNSVVLPKQKFQLSMLKLTLIGLMVGIGHWEIGLH